MTPRRLTEITERLQRVLRHSRARLFSTLKFALLLPVLAHTQLQLNEGGGGRANHRGVCAAAREAEHSDAVPAACMSRDLRRDSEAPTAPTQSAQDAARDREREDAARADTHLVRQVSEAEGR